MSGERIGLYPGTFDPVTLGHLDIVRRAVKLVDRLVIGIADNPSKTQVFSIPAASHKALRRVFERAQQ